MKKHILSLFASAALCLGLFSACDTDAEGVIYSGTGASFASTAMSAEVTAENNGVVLVPVYRSTTEGEATVQLTIDDAAVEEGILSLPNPNVTFAAGEGVASCVVLCMCVKPWGSPGGGPQNKAGTNGGGRSLIRYLCADRPYGACTPLRLPVYARSGEVVARLALPGCCRSIDV